MALLGKQLQQLERKYGRFAVRNLMKYVIGANVIVYFLSLADRSGGLPAALVLHPQLVLRGQIWRLVTFVAIPPVTGVLWLFFALYFSYLVGTNLEHTWGAFKFNVYYLLGMLLTILAAFLTGSPVGASYLNLSLFFAFAHLYPDFELLVYLVLPVKVKYLALLSAAPLLFTLLTAPLAGKIIALVPVFSYVLFFGGDLWQKTRQRNQVRENRRRFFTEIEKARKNKD
ncbi:MAG TPA: rhomboid family intramembrane serine protease [Firmicutes bacterium]|jgi:membrane associated rhomboid family serine protease|nr:rhomboid family intramembrane serine protease [Bacillota bacterium]